MQITIVNKNVAFAHITRPNTIPQLKVWELFIDKYVSVRLESIEYIATTQKAYATVKAERSADTIRLELSANNGSCAIDNIYVMASEVFNKWYDIICKDAEKFQKEVNEYAKKIQLFNLVDSAALKDLEETLSFHIDELRKQIAELTNTKNTRTRRVNK
jgi:hypothetical protein